MSAFDRIVPQLWMLVPPAERLVLAASFTLPHSGITEIRDQDVVTDGYTIDDLQHLTADRMAEWVGSDQLDTSFSRLWELTVAKAHSIVNPPAEMPEGLAAFALKEVSNAEFTEATGQEIPAEPAPEVIAKPKQNAKSTKTK